MKTRRLGDSDLEITSIGLGTYALGGAGWKFAWGPQDDAASIRTLRHGLDSGINWIDTAAVYGHGHAEEIVGKAIADLTAKPLIFTKCGLVWNEAGDLTGVLTAQSVRREIEDSLRRLGLDVIDLYQIHWPRDEEHLEEAWETMAALQEEGKVRYIGASNFNVEQLKRVQKVAPVTSLQPPYSMLNRDIEQEVLPYVREQGIGVIAYAAMQSGLLAGKMTKERVAELPADDWRRGSPYFQEPALSKNLSVAQLVSTIAAEQQLDGKPLTAPEVAISWVLSRPGVTGAIVGARKPEHVDSFLRADQLSLDEATLQRIEAALA